MGAQMPQNHQLSSDRKACDKNEAILYWKSPPLPRLDQLQQQQAGSFHLQSPVYSNVTGWGMGAGLCVPAYQFVKESLPPIPSKETSEYAPYPHPPSPLLVQDVPLPPLRQCFLSGQFCSPP